MRAPRVLVIGAGAFGGWTALELCRHGADVTLIDAWGPGHARASSGGHTRILRAAYGSRSIYTSMARRAFALWRAHDARYRSGLFHQTGGLWLFGDDTTFAQASADALAAESLPFAWLSPDEARQRYPHIKFDDLHAILFEPEAGFLLAERSCAHVVECLVAEGGVYRQVAVRGPLTDESFGVERLRALPCTDGGVLGADIFVFACGPWLGSLFPDALGRLVTPTRQEVLYFDDPTPERAFDASHSPVWVEVGARTMYGIPGNARHRFKIGDDSAGAVFDPTSGSRDVTASSVAIAREYLSRRFPALADARLAGGEVCQYEATPDAHFVIDRHPSAPNVWIVGGGSGHGFKMGPVVGEIVRAAVLDEADPDPTFRLTGPARVTPAGTPKWR